MPFPPMPSRGRCDLKVVRVECEQFANLHDVMLDFEDANAKMVCLTGMNSVGKTALLNLVTLAAGIIGSFGGSYDVASGDMSFKVTFDFTDEDESLWIVGRDEFQRLGIDFDRFINDWSRRVVVCARTDSDGNLLSPRVTVGGLETSEAAGLAFTEVYSRRESLSLVFLDANRAYSYLHEWRRDKMGDAEENSGLAPKILAARSGEQLFTEWSKYLFRKEQNALQRAQQEVRAGASNAELGSLLDPFNKLNSLIHRLIPHISIVGSHARTGRLVFESNGTQLEFQQLSGGEREIVFILGQIEMLSVNSGVVLIDEPEMHLNPVMMRRLVHAIEEFSGDAQTLVATHSFEVVEEALNGGTVYVLSNRLGNGTRVDQVRPGTAHAQLTVHLGMPGMSLSGTRFVAVEGGADKPRATERFRELTGFQSGVQFLAAGRNKRSVIETMSYLVGVATEWGERLDIRGVVDADFQQSESSAPNVLQLGVHEIENIFLHPGSLDTVVRGLGAYERWTTGTAVILGHADRLAGKWVWNRTENLNNKKWSNLATRKKLDNPRKLFRRLNWADIASSDSVYESILGGLGKDVQEELDKSVKAFSELRGSRDLWKWCFGKEVLEAISRDLGLGSDTGRLERHMVKVWKERQVEPPGAVRDILAFLGQDL